MSHVLETTRPRFAWRLLAPLAAWLVLGVVAGLAVVAVLVWRALGQPTRQRVTALAGLAFLVTAIAWLTEGAPFPSEVVAFTTEEGRAWVDGLARVALGLLVAAMVVPDAPARPATSAPPTAPRLPEADRLRAIGIVTVVLIHALPFRPPITYVLDYWLADALRFAVATLVFVSGWLLPARPEGLAWVRHRLARILPAYLVATGVMMAVARLTPAIDPRPVLESVLLARSVGPYYYVFVLVVLTLVTPVIARLGTRRRWVLLAAALATSLAIEVANLSLVWHNHLPLTWLCWYLAGWQLRAHRDGLAAFARRWDGPVAVVAGLVLVSIMLVPIETTPRRILTWVAIAVVTGALLLLTLNSASPRPRPLTQAIGQRSYLIYLYHPAIVAGLAGSLGNSILSGIPIWATVVAVAMCLVASQLARTTWPDHASRWLGA